MFKLKSVILLKVILLIGFAAAQQDSSHGLFDIGPDAFISRLISVVRPALNHNQDPVKDLSHGSFFTNSINNIISTFRQRQGETQFAPIPVTLIGSNDTLNSTEFASNLCVNSTDVSSLLTQLITDLPINVRDTLAVTITMVEILYTNFNSSQWVWDVVIAGLQAAATGTPIQPMVPAMVRSVVAVVMNNQTGEFIERILYNVWLQVPTAGNESFNVTMATGKPIVINSFSNT